MSDDEVLYQCCEHCDRNAEGECVDIADGLVGHGIPCDMSGPHGNCPSCDCTPCAGSKRVTA